MNRNTIALCGVLALLLAAGCGNKGPLYLPEQDTGASDTTVIDQASESGPGGEASE